MQYCRGEYKNVEIIVVNDGSTDNTENIVKKFMLDNHRIKLYNQVNSGVGAARSLGIKMSTGDFIAFCDSDDWFDTNFLQEHIKYLKKYDADISICRTYITGTINKENSNEISVLNKPNIIKSYINYEEISVSLWDKIFKKDVLKIDEIFNDFRYSEDLYMNYIACKYANKIIKFNTTKYNWFNNPASLSRGKFNPIKLECDFAVWNKIIDDCRNNYPDLVETARLSSELWICGTYRLMVSCHYKDKDKENMIARYIHQDGIKVLKAEKNKRNKLFLCFAYVSFPLARIVWYIMNYCKAIIKKIIHK